MELYSPNASQAPSAINSDCFSGGNLTSQSSLVSVCQLIDKDCRFSAHSLNFCWISLQVKGQSRGSKCKRCGEACQRVGRFVGRRPGPEKEQESKHIVLHKTGSSHTNEHVLPSSSC